MHSMFICQVVNKMTLCTNSVLVEMTVGSTSITCQWLQFHSGVTKAIYFMQDAILDLQRANPLAAIQEVVLNSKSRGMMKSVLSQEGHYSENFDIASSSVAEQRSNERSGADDSWKLQPIAIGVCRTLRWRNLGVQHREKDQKQSMPKPH